jgi:hypothetical protein
VTFEQDSQAPAAFLPRLQPAQIAHYRGGARVAPAGKARASAESGSSARLATALPRSPLPQRRKSAT